MGLPVLATQASTTGCAVMTVADSLHFSAVWPEVEQLANQGLIAMAFVNTKSFVAYHGGRSPVLGTNPLAFAFPRAAPNPPLIFDQASSAMARGEIMLHERDGHTLPLGVAIDTNGQPTTNPTDALAGAQLPYAGHKGAAIALMVELLAAGLSGAPFAFQARETDNQYNDGGPTSNGETIIAIDPRKVWPADEFEARLQRIELLFEQILSDDGARLPSDRRYKVRQTSEESGVEVKDELFQTCKKLAGEE
eukprot:c19864_g1_i4.p1 GENE.c19864_g1_i4~~c19864_g1_i4.p1  ORF type:complete len:250 (+),score=49.14 c19864_g1_i4:353-1102(+)